MHLRIRFVLGDSLCTVDVFKLPNIKICVGIKYFKTLNKRHSYTKFKLSPFQASLTLVFKFHTFIDDVCNNCIFLWLSKYHNTSWVIRGAIYFNKRAFIVQSVHPRTVQCKFLLFVYMYRVHVSVAIKQTY